MSIDRSNTWPNILIYILLYYRAGAVRLLAQKPTHAEAHFVQIGFVQAALKTLTSLHGGRRD